MKRRFILLQSALALSFMVGGGFQTCFAMDVDSPNFSLKQEENPFIKKNTDSLLNTLKMQIFNLVASAQAKGNGRIHPFLIKEIKGRNFDNFEDTETLKNIVFLASQAKIYLVDYKKVLKDNSTRISDLQEIIEFFNSKLQPLTKDNYSSYTVYD